MPMIVTCCTVLGKMTFNHIWTYHFKVELLKQKIIITTFFEDERFSSFFCKWTHEIQGSSVQPLKTLKPFQLTWALRFMNVIETWQTWESFVFKNHCDWIIFFQVPILWADYSWLFYNGHLYRTHTSVKQTPKVGLCLSLLPLFDSL